ncbi:DUF3784 domain-containing protein [Planococcus koreensis]|uniref:DUF3784 domain-containing protein n=1 Tax=Planococcus koreensis TaxID=112331 RepID=UPI0039FCB075
MSMEMIVPLGVIILFLILSIYLLQGKGAMLISGYNTMSKEDKAQYDTVALCKATGKLMLGVTVSISLIFAGDLFHQNWLFIVGTVLMIANIVIGLIYMNTGNRYKKNQK